MTQRERIAAMQRWLAARNASPVCGGWLLSDGGASYNVLPCGTVAAGCARVGRDIEAFEPTQGSYDAVERELRRRCDSEVTQDLVNERVLRDVLNAARP